MIYFTADIHFYHENIINHTKRPFKNADEMNRKIIDNWNNIVKANDEVYILGDVTMKGASNANTVLSQLKGKKYLIKGNHDHFVEEKNFCSYIFEWVKDYYELEYEGNFFVLFHYNGINFIEGLFIYMDINIIILYIILKIYKKA